MLYLTGCGDAAGGGGTPTPPPTPPTTSTTSTIEQSVYVSTITGTTFETGSLAYMWTKFSWDPVDLREAIYMKFDVTQIPSTATIESASLRVWVSTFDAVNMAVVYQASGSWDRTTIQVTTNEPAHVGTPVASTTVSALGFNSFNIKTLVQAWVKGTSPNYGIVLQPYSKANGISNRTVVLDHNDTVNFPRISITYY